MKNMRGRETRVFVWSVVCVFFTTLCYETYILSYRIYGIKVYVCVFFCSFLFFFFVMAFVRWKLSKLLIKLD